MCFPVCSIYATVCNGLTDCRLLCAHCVGRLPSDVYFCEEPTIVRWDYERKQWRTDGFIDKLYNEGQLNLSPLNSLVIAY